MISKYLSYFRRYLRVKSDPIGYARSIGVQVGDDCRFIGVSLSTFGSEPYLITIGNHVTITGNVRFITHDGGVWVLRPSMPDIDVIAPVSIGDNVFIGVSTIVMPGVSIGNDCVIGAGSVVTKDVPDGSVAAGVPAKVLRTLDAYREKSLERGLNTKGLEPDIKRQYLLDRFTRSSR